MNSSEFVLAPASSIPNGSGAAAVLSAGIGCFALAVLAFVGDKSPALKRLFVFYKPTGPLSGVTTAAIVIWFVSSGILEWRWSKQNLKLNRVGPTALSLLVLSLRLTFPPLVDLF